ncbi:NADPH oxidase 5-like [Patiria miniata]|uniref:NADPH oxidase 5 n=1 Tax=Patiria miniata TaxID=46514 RepID=A0A914A2C5_PATMI|nr:NADPH oxidase 5-like [Patiria miniata]XP_038057988.1 NADPH oxidase 5-like [Patiria miniata]
MEKGEEFRLTVEDDAKWLEWAQRQFAAIAGNDRLIDWQEFKLALKVKKEFFAKRFFALFDADNSGTISLDELMDGLRMLTHGEPAEKLRFLFNVYDVDGSGQIDHEELRTVLESCMEESALQLSSSVLDELTDALFEAADEDGSGAISFDELRRELEKYPDVMENMTIGAAGWLKPPDDEPKTGPHLPRYLTPRYINNNLRKVIFVIAYCLLNAALFTEAAYRFAFRGANWCIIVARGCGQCLNLNSSLILVLMLRQTLTYIRSTRVARLLPIDQHIIFHKTVGLIIAALSLVHSLAHVGNAVIITSPSGPLPNNTAWDVLFTQPHLTPLGLVKHSAFLTGWLLDIILVVMVICSLPFVRRSGNFQVFYWTHLMYIFFWVLLLMHGPRFWYWFIVPGIIFILERVSQLRLVRQAQFGKMYVEKADLMPSGVTHLMITRPPHFDYSPGDYLFVNIPQIAKHEWHPFTISSAPEEPDTISLHVRSAGNWTNKLYSFYDERHKRNRQVSIRSRSRKSNGSTSTEKAAEADPLCLDVPPSPPSDPYRYRSGGDQGSRHPVTKSMGWSDKNGKSATYVEVSTGGKHSNGKHRKLKRDPTNDRVEVFINGPYGTATRAIFRAEHAVLIGAGIGVTPFASILQSIMLRCRTNQQTCPNCQHEWIGSVPEHVMRIKKVDFIWINRNQKAFEWFVRLLTQLELQQAGMSERFLDMHMFMTAALGKTDMKGVGLQMALDIMHSKGNKDMITGLKTRTQPGRPDWDKLFADITGQRKGKVQVFFCGSPILGKTIKAMCEKYKFHFHKENF